MMVDEAMNETHPVIMGVTAREIACALFMLSTCCIIYCLTLVFEFAIYIGGERTSSLGQT